MDYLIKDLAKLKDKLRDRFIFLFLDYDGTLVPIAETPEKAVMPKKIKELLVRLSASRQRRVAVISGRSLADIKKMVGLKNIIYAGNHGLEIEGPKIRFESQVPMCLRTAIRDIYEAAVCKFSQIKGVLIEDKGLTISIHYRSVDEKDTNAVLRIFNDLTCHYLARGEIQITSGKKVLEIRPPSRWDKGKVVLWLLARQQFLSDEDDIFPVYIGDDATDEDAFRALKNRGLTIFVGQGKSEAEYYLKDNIEVAGFLELVSCQN